jgi:ABC-type phosphate transport system substrate-binding protein
MTTETIQFLLAIFAAFCGGLGTVWFFMKGQIEAKEKDNHDLRVDMDKMWAKIADLENKVGYLEGKQASEANIKTALESILNKIDKISTKKIKN